MNKEDRCPKCESSARGPVGLHYVCGSYFTFGGFTQSGNCSFAEERVKESIKELV